MTYQSPYLNGESGSDQITVTMGPVKHSLDFSEYKDTVKEPLRLLSLPLTPASFLHKLYP
jgi:hypothetical protein